MYTKIKIFAFTILTLFTSYTGFAQCAMCRAVLESEETGVTAEAVNDGIVYLMAFPYILVTAVGIIVYRIMNKKDKEAK